MMISAVLDGSAEYLCRLSTNFNCDLGPLRSVSGSTESLPENTRDLGPLRRVSGSTENLPENSSLQSNAPSMRIHLSIHDQDY